MTLIQKYTLASVLFVLALVLGLGTVITRQLSQRMLERDGELTAEFVRAQVREHLGLADFATGAPGTFADVFREISKIPEILQVNVFDRNGTVIWSSEASLIGQRFPGNRNLQEALAGRPVTGVADHKPEQLRGPGVPSPLVELYVPLSFEGETVVGVLETYKAPVLLEHIRQAILVTWGFVALGGGLLYVSLLWLVRRVWLTHAASLAASAAIAIENARLFAQVQRGRAEWQETFDVIGDSVILVSPRYEVMRVNLAGAAIVEMTPQELIGRPCCELFCGRLDPRPDCPVAETLRSGRSAAVEVVSANGDPRTFQIRSYPVSGGRGGIEAVVEHRRDITELKEAEERLIQVEKLRGLGDLASGVAHDFNNILAVIMGRANLLAASLEGGGLDAERLRRGLKLINQAAGDGAAIVRRIQDFARVKRAGDFVPFNLNAVVREAVEFTRPRWADEARARGIEIAVDLRLAEVPPAEGNAAEVREVLTNMILNAVDAMPRGGRISLGTWFKGSHVYVAVTDTGVGMSEMVRRRIFDPFFTTKGTKGTGLGLSVAYGIIQRHGGEIRVESAPGRGSTFTVRLLAASKPLAAASAPPPEVARRARILLIDDKEEVLGTLKEILVSAGHTVSAAESGEAGIAAFRQGEFDLVLSDLGMPGMSGWDVAREVRESKPTVPVVLVTGWDEQVDPELLRQSGVVRVVAKPVEMEGLLRIVSDVLRGRTGP